MQLRTAIFSARQSHGLIAAPAGAFRPVPVLLARAQAPGPDGAPAPVIVHGLADAVVTGPAARSAV